MKLVTIISLFFFSLSVFAFELKEGQYRLLGQNANGTTYEGAVTILKSDEGYRLRWRIGESQEQEGIAYMSNGVLSVSYRDLASQDAGVVHFQQIQADILEGPWRSFASDKTSGTERLEYLAP